MVKKVADNYKEIIENVGEDVAREGLIKTPERASKAMHYLTHGYDMNPQEILRKALFHEDHNEMVIVKDIELYSLCEHHMLPFFGKAHIAYIPNGKIVGLSKLPRLVDVFARRLQVQERMTQEIANTLDEYLNPAGVGVVAEAYHMCMMMRGVEKQNSYTLTSAMHGDFKNDARTRGEFLDLISHKRI